MATCVGVLPSGSDIGIGVGRPVRSSIDIIVVDDSCSSGLLLLTQSELDSNKIQVNASSDPARVQDMTDLFYAFLLALVVVWGVKQLLNLFTGDTERG